MTAENLWEAIQDSTGKHRPATVSVSEYAEIVGISKISAHRMVARGDVETLKLPGIATKRIPIDEVFRAFGVSEMGTAVAAAVPGETQDSVVASLVYEVSP